MKIKTGDNVRVIAGKHKGKEGKVLQTFPARSLVVVDGVNQAVKHIKAKGKNAVGQRVTFNAPFQSSKVAVVTEGGVKGRVGYEVKDGKKFRVLRVNGKVKGKKEVTQID